MGSTALPWLQSMSGRIINPTLLDINDVDIDDIAHSLSHLVRFTGHCAKPYTVAQHSVLVSLICNPVFAREALLHDAAEAYVNDLNTPVKRLLPKYEELEDDIIHVIYKKYGLAVSVPDDVITADQKMFRLEVLRFFPNGCPLWRHYKVQPQEYIDSQVKITTVWDHHEAKMQFLARYNVLFESEFLPSSALVVLNG